MLREHSKMKTEIDRIAARYSKAIERAARKAMSKNHRLIDFNASMGSVSFYDPQGPVDYDKLSKAARAVVNFAEAYEDAFGSPGIYVELP